MCAMRDTHKNKTPSIEAGCLKPRRRSDPKSGGTTSPNRPRALDLHLPWPCLASAKGSHDMQWRLLQRHQQIFGGPRSAILPAARSKRPMRRCCWQSDTDDTVRSACRCRRCCCFGAERTAWIARPAPTRGWFRVAGAGRGKTSLLRLWGW